MRRKHLLKSRNRRGVRTPAAMVVVGDAGMAAGSGNIDSSKTMGLASPGSSKEGQVPCRRTSEIIAIPESVNPRVG
jgi:hypothetical protein